MVIVCKSLFSKDVPNVHHLHRHMPREWRRFLHWSIAVSIMPCWTSDHTAINIPSNNRCSVLDRNIIWFCWKFSVLCSSKSILQIDQELATKFNKSESESESKSWPDPRSCSLAGNQVSWQLAQRSDGMSFATRSVECSTRFV